MNIQTTLLFVSFVATVLLGFIVVPILKKKKIGQVVREEGPKSHLQKNGTPIMGGIIIILVVTAILAFFVKDYPILIMPMIAIFGYGVVGFLDDFKKLILKDPEGMSPKMKMLGLFIVTAILIVLYLFVFNLGTSIIIPIFNQPISLGIPIFILFAAFILLGTTNAVNLTDGLDGLATGVVAIIMTFFTLEALRQQNYEMVVFSASTVGACIGFLLFNMHPAKVFMGDTGSLALGGAVAITALILKMPLYLAIVAFVCIIDTISVMLQVIYFKATKGKRLFKMAPFHHHLELSGYKETTVVLIFWIITIICCVIAYLI
ncbi:MAG: phospho-N-acetylmuramoyl-pentapeptide-transferase [Clostridia bacterium]